MDSTRSGGVTQLLVLRATRTPAGIAQWTRSNSGHWESTTWAELHAIVARIARGLYALGVEPGDRVAILAAGRAEWDRVHLGAMAARALVVGLDVHASAPQLRAMLATTRPSWLIVDDPSRLSAIGTDALTPVRTVVTLCARRDDAPGPDRTWLTLAELMGSDPGDSSAPWNLAQPDDPAWVIFTSGTTGEPKALLYRHHQLRAAVDAILDAFDDIREGAHLASWLPLANPFQRIINLCAVACGAQTYYVSEPRDVMLHLPAIRPNVFIGVPRFFEKFHAGVMARLDDAGPLTSRVARWAIAVGARRASLQRTGRMVPASLDLMHRLADALVLRRIRAAFGGELRYMVSGSAAMPLWLLERLHAMGLLVLEAYGLSECIVPVAMNRPRQYRFGAVGRPAKGNEIRIAADGELLLRSPGVFEGYLGADQARGDAAIDHEGFLATGDYARVDDDGFITLEGRKSEVFKTSTGRRVAPAMVEAALRAIPGVEHAAVFGAGRKSLLAVVVIGPDAAASSPQIRQAARRWTAGLPDYLRPAGLVVSRRPLTIDAGELTTNLKLRRQRVYELYGAALAALAELVDGPSVDRDATHDFEPGVVQLVTL